MLKPILQVIVISTESEEIKISVVMSAYCHGNSKLQCKKKKKRNLLHTDSDLFDHLYDEIMKRSRNSPSGRSALQPRTILSNCRDCDGAPKAGIG